MPDYLEAVPNDQSQPDWQAMVRDLEKRIEVLSDALGEVKLAMRRLVMAEPWLSDGAPHVEYDDDAREAVRRAVEDTRSQIAPGFVTEDRPDVSWVTVPDNGASPGLTPVAGEVPGDSADDEEAAREAVRRAVEEAKAELRHLAPSQESEEDGEAARRAAEQAKGGLGAGWGSASPTYAAQPPSPQPVDDPEAAREAARQAIEAAKAEMGFATASNAPSVTPVDDEEAAREAVRQAVAQARAEMASGGGIAGGAAKPVEIAPAFVVPPPHRPERVHPPTITIEDPEGRVELARVYNLLKRLDVAANSSLLNYSSRQVSVQLSDSKVAPDGDNVGNAVRDVFERENDVSVDGLNLIVKLGSDYIRAA